MLLVVADGLSRFPQIAAGIAQTAPGDTLPASVARPARNSQTLLQMADGLPETLSAPAITVWND
jgi:hypothetical protein